MTVSGEWGPPHPGWLHLLCLCCATKQHFPRRSHLQVSGLALWCLLPECISIQHQAWLSQRSWECSSHAYLHTSLLHLSLPSWHALSTLLQFSHVLCRGPDYESPKNARGRRNPGLWLQCKDRLWKDHSATQACSTRRGLGTALASCVNCINLWPHYMHFPAHTIRKTRQFDKSIISKACLTGTKSTKQALQQTARDVEDKTPTFQGSPRVCSDMSQYPGAIQGLWVFQSFLLLSVCCLSIDGFISGFLSFYWQHLSFILKPLVTGYRIIIECVHTCKMYWMYMSNWLLYTWYISAH